MKKFNLEDALAGKKLITRHGQRVTFGCYNPKARGSFPVIVWINDNELSTHKMDGSYQEDQESPFDLFIDETVYSKFDLADFFNGEEVVTESGDKVTLVAIDYRIEPRKQLIVQIGDEVHHCHLNGIGEEFKLFMKGNSSKKNDGE